MKSNMIPDDETIEYYIALGKEIGKIPWTCDTVLEAMVSNVLCGYPYETYEECIERHHH